MKSKKAGQKTIASARIEELFSQARELFKEDPSFSNKYVNLARRISLKYKISFSKQQKSHYCKACKSYLFPGQNSRVRLNKGKKIVKCFNCNNIMRFVYK